MTFQSTFSLKGRSIQSLLLVLMVSNVLSLTEIKNIAGDRSGGLECEADCDNDAQCAGDLKCWQRDSGGAIPPQCVRADDHVENGWDICYDPNWVATTLSPTGIPSATPTDMPSAEPTEFHCDAHGCPDHMVCEKDSGICVRNCEVFAIDEYLSDCSAVPNTVSTMQTSISDNEARIARIESALDQMVVSIDKVSSARSPLGNVDETAMLGNVSENVLTLTGKDLLMVVLLIVNVFMMIAMAAMCFRGTTTYPVKY